LAAQWIPVSGIEGDNCFKIVQQDSTLFMSTTGYGVVARNIRDTSWVQVLDEFSRGIMVVNDTALIGFSNWGDTFVSFSKGLDWETIHNPDLSPYKMESLDSLIFVQDYWGIAKSNDFCHTWLSVVGDSANGFSYFLFADNTYLYYCDNNANQLFYSDNYGYLFDSIPLNGFTGNVTNMIDVQSHDSTFWLASSLGLFRYNPDSASWFLYADSLIFNSFDLIGNHLYGSGNGIWRLSDNGSNWINESQGIERASVKNMLECNHMFYCASSEGCYTSDTAILWLPFNQGLHGFWISSISIHENEVWASTSGGLFRSLDFGESFTKMPSPGSINATKIVITDSLYFLSSYKNFFISYNHGESWVDHTVSTSLSNYYITDFALGSTYIFLYMLANPDEFFYRSSYTSIDWEAIDNDEILNGYHLAAHDSSILIAKKSSTYLQNPIYLSKDNGDHITLLEVLPGGNYPVIKFVNDRMFVAEDNKLFYSDDGGTTWIDRLITDPLILVTDVSSNQECMLACGYMFEYTPLVSISYDNGSTWTSIAGNLVNCPSNSFSAIEVSGTRIFMGSQSNGLWFRDDLLTGIPGKQISVDGPLSFNPNPANESVELKLFIEQSCHGEI